MEIAIAESGAAAGNLQCRKMKLLSCSTSNARLDWFIERKLVFHIFFMAG
jgi:hypothetical protein